MANESLSFAHPLSPTISPFDLPEITINISSYLRHHDLARCIQACKSWYYAFLPSVWSPPPFLNINLSTDDQPREAVLQPTSASLLRHAALVRDLRFQNSGALGKDWFEYLSAPGLTHLRTLTLLHSGKVRLMKIVARNPGGGQGVVGVEEVYWNALIDVLRRSCTLDLLRLVNLNPPCSMAAHFWDNVAGCGSGVSRSLRTLELHRFIENPNAGQRSLLDVIGPLKSIERLTVSDSSLMYPLRRSNNSNQQQGQEPVYFLNIKTIHLIGNFDGPLPACQRPILYTPNTPTLTRPSAQLQLLCLCPNLEDITLTNYKTRLSNDQISKALTDRTWLLLKSLTLFGFGYQDLEMSYILLNSFQDAQLEALSLEACLFGEASLAAFESRKLFERIRKLHIMGAVDGPSTRISRILQRILEICPRLESFGADTILAKDIIHGQEWACKGCLRHLKAVIDLGYDREKESPSEVTTIHRKEDFISSKTRRQRALFKRLNTLHNLQELDLIRRSPGYTFTYPLNLDLRHGLDILSGLRNLQKLYFLKEQRMTMEDLEWMKKHWPRFSEITQSLHVKGSEESEVLDNACRNFGWSLRPNGR
ncbi:hypothetical protein F5H01DRAFT_368261 [Linnemannia elongata]|nr:hypothetical protein F5H01DRAFT_368261 [Linnemannia elongata]